MDTNDLKSNEELIHFCMRQGKRLLRGRGVPRDYERALECFDRAAQAGDVDALYMLGKCYLKGIGCRKDPNGGVDCLERAAQRGHGAAALRLGMCFEEGIGSPRNAELAAYWYRRAAAAGESKAFDCMLRLNASQKESAT